MLLLVAAIVLGPFSICSQLVYKFVEEWFGVRWSDVLYIYSTCKLYIKVTVYIYILILYVIYIERDIEIEIVTVDPWDLCVIFPRIHPLKFSRMVSC